MPGMPGRRSIQALLFELAQDVRQTFLDTRDIAAAVPDCFEPLKQMMHALLDMIEGSRAVGADLKVIETI